VFTDDVDVINFVFDTRFISDAFLHLPARCITRLICDRICSCEYFRVPNNAVLWCHEICDGISIEGAAQATDPIPIFVTGLQQDSHTIVGDREALVREGELSCTAG